MQLSKRLTYVVNMMVEGDTQHFVHIPNLLSHLRDLGWEVDILSERGGSGTKDVLGHRVHYLSRASRWGRMVQLVIQLIRLRLQGGRLVFVRISKSAAFVSAILGHALGWKTVFWLSGTVEDFNARNSRFGFRLSYYSMWALLRMVDRLATGPETMASYYIKTYKLRPSKILMLYNDIHLPDTFQPATNFASDNLLLVHRLSPVRETTRYFPALIRHLNAYCSAGRRVTLNILGDGPERQELEELCSTTSQFFVRFHGAVPNRDLGAHYANATIFLMPSYREGFPRVLLEAMAHGLPLVSTDAGGSRDLLGPRQREFAFDRDDPEAFASGVVKLLVDADLRAGLREENLATVQRFDTPEIAAMYDRALTTLLPIGAAHNT